MKSRITTVALKRLYGKVYNCGASELQIIYKHVEPEYYNCGTYGWNFDVYTEDMYDVAITTGYRNTVGKKIDRALLQKYEAKAEEILVRHAYWCDELAQELRDNREAFVRDLIGKGV